MRAAWHQERFVALFVLILTSPIPIQVADERGPVG
jgi:hypothetical protein